MHAHLLIAQVPSRAMKIGHGFADSSSDELAILTDLYFSGDWQRLQQQTMNLLQKLQFAPVSQDRERELRFDFQRHHYSIVFVYTGPDRKEEVLRFLVHDPPAEPYVARLPGIRGGDDQKLYEIFLSPNPDDVLISTYLSVREPGKLESELPKFLKQFDPKVLKGLLEAVAPRHRIFAVMSRVDLPYSRSSIQVSDVVQKPKGTVAQNFKLFNRPLTRFSFGVVSSLIASSRESNTRATIQSGELTEDPLRGHMPMGILNIHPWAYDDEAEEVDWRERFRLFVGGIVAPEFGLSAGAGIQFVRGFSLNAGVGLLLIDTLKEGEEIGKDPVDPHDPFEYGTATVLFFGVGYNF